MASIVIISGKRKGDFYRLGERVNVVGRDEDIPIQILDDGISRRHLRIRFDHRTFAYSADDMASKNGVLINGSRIDKETILKDTDIITIGNTELLFTNKDFFDRDTSLAHIRRLGESHRPTRAD
jgi:pSer/pThr/pTyr-binding forkhead associated (FHA) protein